MKKAVFAFALALALAGCNGTRNGDASLVAATGVLAEPAEGVYPNCKFGVLAPDDRNAPGCIKPRDEK